MKHTEWNVETGEVTVRDMTPEEIADRQNGEWAALRFKRNELLIESDWTVLTDTPTTTAAWKAYRQALRDLPANTTDPLNVVWPTPPA
jgi:hypothetical protein